METVAIREPYWGAWKEFGWDKSVWGLGINEAILFGKQEEFLRIYSEYHKIYYLVNVAEARARARLFKEKRKGVTLYVIPMTILRPEVKVADSKMVGESGQPEAETKKVNEPREEARQKDMFGGKPEYTKG